MGKVNPKKRIPGMGRSNQEPGPTCRHQKVTTDSQGNQLTYKQRFEQRRQQPHYCAPAQQAHRGPTHREQGLQRKDWVALMTRPFCNRSGK